VGVARRAGEASKFLSRSIFVAALVSLVSLALPARRAFGDEEKKPVEAGPWTFNALVGLNLAQSAYSDNWAGGDKGSIVWVLNSDIEAERQFNPRFNLSNLLQLAYGQTAKQVADPSDPSRNRWDRPEKSTDLILFESVGRWTLNKYVDPFISFRLDSQFRDQSNPIGEIALNPVKLTETAGLARVHVKTETSEWISRVGFGFRQTLSNTFVDSLGAETERFSTNDGGFEFQSTMTRPILEKRVVYKGKLLVFFPVFYSQSDALEEFDTIALGVDPTREEVAGFWKAPDVNFQNAFTAQITKIISVNLYLQFVYDKFDAATNVDTSLPTPILVSEIERGVRKAGQFKQTLAIGLTYALF
jgi:hypothetical protein